jgi:small-conductance mechanosensitive channel
MIGITLLGIISIILVLPISESLRGHILSLLGIILSAALALSSTTLIGNALAGVMIRGISNFQIGDFVEVDEHFGRVSEMGLFHIEVQTEDRNLVTLPNLSLVTKSVKVFYHTGTIVMAEISLGYDVPRSDVKRLLIEAAEKAELTEPFVYILKLGDFSISYRVTGLLKEVKHFITARSRLHEEILDVIHNASIEIVSPNFMNTRTVNDIRFIPSKQESEIETSQEATPEETVFHKAEKAQELEKAKMKLVDIENKIKEAKEKLKTATGEKEREAIEEDIAQLEIYSIGIKVKIEKMQEKIEEKREK